MKFRSLESVPSLPKLIELGLVIDGYIIDELAEIAADLHSSFDESHIQINISFASLAPERAILAIVD